jgi:predicted DNA-binding transcriptional regulator AlpA
MISAANGFCGGVGAGSRAGVLSFWGHDMTQEVIQRAFAAWERFSQCGATEPTAHTPPDPRLRRMLKLEQVLQIVPVSETTLWRMEKEGRFPKGDFISYNTKVWYEDEVIAWQNSTSGRSRGRRPRKAQG